ncbi:MAG: FAD-dependent oxidoreductase [bacterium]
MKINIDGKQFDFSQGETILQVAKRNGVEIPSLCFDERFAPYTSCFICIVMDKKSGRFVPSCSVKASEGMDIITTNDEIKKYRKMALELLLSEHDADCFSPCKTACPAGIDVRDYILFSRSGQELEGFLTVRKKNPLVSIIGRVCPAFCENDCSRIHIDETVGIRLLKRYLGDSVYGKHYSELLKIEKGMIDRKLAKPKNIAVIGGGPAGLSAAYYLTLAGHKVTIHEQQPKLGGMLRYAIPTYRLPVDVLDQEISSIIDLGVSVKTGVNVNKELLQELSKENDIVLLTIGTWKETALGLNEAPYANVIPAVSFLRKVVEKKISSVGKKVIVIGGGNSAIDAARVSKRLGAEVSLVYRRTRKEMPALSAEIDDALNEGIKLFELMSPCELTPSSTAAVAGSIKFMKMELSNELDSSGRRKIKGTDSFETFDLDTLVYAIGQKPEPELLEAIKSMDLKNVQIAGDARLGASTVIEAVADARKTAEKIIGMEKDELSFYSLRENGVLVRSKNKKIKEIKVKHLAPLLRAKAFSEVEAGYTKTTAVDEAKRCINCGCTAVEDCDLRKYSVEHEADPNKFKHLMDKGKRALTGAEHVFSDESLKYMFHETAKCIKCGKCIKVCDDVVGAHALSFIGRGLNVVLSSNTDNNMSDSTCIMCGMCIDSCPTGSLSESVEESKWTQIVEKVEECKGCVLKCKLNYGYSDGKIFRARSYDTPICPIGRWGWKNNYEDVSTYYRGIVKTTTKTGLPKANVEDGNYLNESDHVLSLNYEPSADNPRAYYEFTRLSQKGSKITTISSASNIPDLKKYSRPLLVLNYFNYDPGLLKDILKKYPEIKILPVYYRTTL